MSNASIMSNNSCGVVGVKDDCFFIFMFAISFLKCFGKQVNNLFWFNYCIAIII